MLCLLLLAPLAAFALGIQQPQEEPATDQDEEFRIGVAVDQVFLSVTARHFGGGFAKGLEKEDFRVYEDGVEQEIVNFSSGEVPVHVVLLIDASGSTRHTQPEIRRAAMSFSRHLNERDQIAIITFNHDVRLIKKWTNDLDKVQLALETIYAQGRTLLNDAIYVTFDDLLRDVDGRKAVILLTDGVDTGSVVSFEEALGLALRSEAIVYVVSKLDEYWAGAIAGRQRPGLWTRKELRDEYIIQVRRSLTELAEKTGGRLLDSKSFTTLTDVYRNVAEELRNQYYISYIPSDRRKDGTWRSIEVRLPYRPDVVASTRQGYFAGQESPQQP